MTQVSEELPTTLTLPSCPPVKAAEEAVIGILKKWHITSDEARKMVRVEITRTIATELRSLASTANYHLIHNPATVGPMQIMGVSYYVVDNLPDPGWRVLP